MYIILVCLWLIPLSGECWLETGSAQALAHTWWKTRAKIFFSKNLVLEPLHPWRTENLNLIFSFVKRFWRLRDIDDWHYIHWEEAKFFLMESCDFSPVVANYTLPSLDYLWPCAYALATGVVPDPVVPDPVVPLAPVIPVAAFNFIPAAFVGEDWD